LPAIKEQGKETLVVRVVPAEGKKQANLIGPDDFYFCEWPEIKF